MSKQITSVELAEMLSQVILRVPGTPLAGEHKDTEYNDFMHKIAQELAFACGYAFGGGDFEPCYIDPISDEESEEFFVSFGPASQDQANDHEDLMAPYDIEGWADLEEESMTQLDADTLRAKRMSEVFSKMVRRMRGTVNIDTHVRAWDREDEQIKPTQIAISPENVYLSYKDDQQVDEFTLCMELDKGAPAVHIMGDGQDCTLHIHKMNQKLMITPDQDDAYEGMTEKGEGVYRHSQSIKVSID